MSVDERTTVTVRDAFAFLGAALLFGGLWLVSHALALVVIGLLLLVVTGVLPRPGERRSPAAEARADG